MSGFDRGVSNLVGVSIAKTAARAAAMIKVSRMKPRSVTQTISPNRGVQSIAMPEYSKVYARAIFRR